MQFCMSTEQTEDYFYKINILTEQIPPHQEIIMQLKMWEILAPLMILVTLTQHNEWKLWIKQKGQTTELH